MAGGQWRWGPMVTGVNGGGSNGIWGQWYVGPIVSGVNGMWGQWYTFLYTLIMYGDIMLI